MFKCIFLNENVWIPIEISLKFVPKGSINNNPALFQIMAWRRPGDKPLSEPMMVRSLTHICVTRPQWFNPSKTFLMIALLDTNFHHCESHKFAAIQTLPKSILQMTQFQRQSIYTSFFTGWHFDASSGWLLQDGCWWNDKLHAARWGRKNCQCRWILEEFLLKGWISDKNIY